MRQLLVSAALLLCFTPFINGSGIDQLCDLGAGVRRADLEVSGSAALSHAQQQTAEASGAAQQLKAGDNACIFDKKKYYPGYFNPDAVSTNDLQSTTSIIVQPGTNNTTCPDPHQVPPGAKFPFWFGMATAAHQIEGATFDDGKGASVWNVFEHYQGGRNIADRTTADVACDFYHKFDDDIKIMSYLGVRNFRFSMSWPRLFPTGRPPINPAGVVFYKKLISTLRAHCIEPMVTLFHWDFPQTLYEEYQGFINPRVEDDFVQYSTSIWEIFKDDVQYWTTMNEPETFCILGYELGIHAPGRCSDRSRCEHGNSTTEGWLCAYHVLNIHAKAEKAFRRIIPSGKLSINLSLQYLKPLSDSAEDAAACERLMQYNAGRYGDVLYTGDWSDVVKKNVPSDVLPVFSMKQQELLKGCVLDYYALQHYTSRWCGYREDALPLQAYISEVDSQGTPLPEAGLPWLKIVPDGLRHLLIWLKHRYNNPSIVITENGMCQRGEENMTRHEMLCDVQRMQYYKEYIGNATLAATEDGVNLQGYFAWSMMDNFEWAEGLKKRFGVVLVDYTTLARYLKASSLWLSNVFGVRGRIAPPQSENMLGLGLG